MDALQKLPCNHALQWDVMHALVDVAEWRHSAEHDMQPMKTCRSTAVIWLFNLFVVSYSIRSTFCVAESVCRCNPRYCHNHIWAAKVWLEQYMAGI